MAKNKNPKNKKTLFLINPRGFCSGVERAIAITAGAIKNHRLPLFVYHEIVHNEKVVDHFKKLGITFIKSLDKLPKNSRLIISAHGISPEIRLKAEKNGVMISDATCPLVNKVHAEARYYHQKGFKIVLIGKKRHDEIKGIKGEAPLIVISSPVEVKKITYKSNDRLMILSQTTFSVQAKDKIIKKINRRFAHLYFPENDDICPATASRQQAVSFFTPQVDMVLVAGSGRSNNAKELVATAAKAGKPSRLISESTGIKKNLLAAVSRIGLTAGASTSENEVKKIVSRIKRFYPDIEIKEAFIPDQFETSKF